MLGQKGHDVVFRLGQAHLLPFHEHLAAVVVDAQSLSLELPAGCCVSSAAVAVQPQGSAHAGQKFAGAEGLGDVIIGTQIQRFDLIHLVGAGREHHDGGHILLPHGADEFQPVPVRQAQVQDHQIRVVGCEQGQAHGAGVRHQRLIVVRGQQRFNEAADVRLVLHDQHLIFIIVHPLHPPVRFSPSPARNGWSCPRRGGSLRRSRRRGP